MTVWVVLPAFNEEDNLPPLLRRLEAVMREAGLACQVVVVDDGSRDRTRAVAEAHAGRLPVQVVAHETNRGLARAVETGLRRAAAGARSDDVVVTMDADNTHPADLLPDMVRRVEDGADVVIASRYAPGGVEEGVPLLRRVLSLGVRVLMRLRYGLDGVRDYSSGYRAYRASLLQAAAAAYGPRLIESQGFSVMAELLVKLRPFRPRAAEVPLHLRYDRKVGASKMRVLRTVGEYARLLARRTHP